MTKYRAILTVASALLVLFSSSSFMVGMHLCGGHVQNVALFTKAEGCEMEKKMPPCHKQKEPCCDDETVIHTGEDFNVSKTDISTSPVPLWDATWPPVFVSEIIPSSPISRIQFYKYDPPTRAGDRTVSLQVFLI
jgi:hypothetical protein